MEGRLQDRCQLCSEVRLAAVRAAGSEHIAEVPAAGIRPVVAHSSEAVRMAAGILPAADCNFAAVRNRPAE